MTLSNLGNSNMATSCDIASQAIYTSQVDILLHPELLSRDFLQMVLSEKRLNSDHCESGDQLVELFVRHVIPRPQRSLPNSRWGKRMAKTRARREPSGSGQDGVSKAKKPETSLSSSSAVADRLKPPPARNLTNPIRRLSATSSSSSSNQKCSHSVDTASLKRDANCSSALTPPEVKRKIQHVTWP
ncbi:ashwin [Stigmatopora argus]